MDSKKIFDPPPEWVASSNLTGYMAWLKKNKGLAFSDYDSLRQWSVSQLEDFWASILEYFNVHFTGSYQQVLSSHTMPGVKWFEGIHLNYAAHLTRHQTLGGTALIACNESGLIRPYSWQKIIEDAAALQRVFKRYGLGPGDRVAAYLPNIPEASIALLAVVASGLVWSSCSPEFGSASVIDRVSQIQPRVLIAVDHYRYSGKLFDRRAELSAIVDALSSLELLIMVDPLPGEIPEPGSSSKALWTDLIREEGEHPLEYVQLPFEHPMWVLYSSGTTGLPKAITHSQGGMLLEHLKYIHFHNDVRPGELFFWYSTTGWMMWNYLHTSWLAGAIPVLYDGHPAFPEISTLWNLARDLGINHFGTSAPFIHACMKEGLVPPDLPVLRSISSTGSPLSAEAYDWLYHRIGHPFYLWSMSGGTDVCTAFVGGCPLLPVYEGEIQCRALGCDLRVFDEYGHELWNEVGELVIVKPMPCMPIYFWNDPGGHKYHEAYFEVFAGVWRHGDWIRLTSRQGIVISGRSDTTLNRLGVRIGTAEIYSALQQLEEVEDGLIIHIDRKSGEAYMPLFVKLKQERLDDHLLKKIRAAIRNHCSPRHVPDEIIQVREIPYTLSGKKMENAVKKIFQGKEVAQVASPGAMRNPASLDEYLEIRKSMKEVS